MEKQNRDETRDAALEWLRARCDAAEATKERERVEAEEDRLDTIHRRAAIHLCDIVRARVGDEALFATLHVNGISIRVRGGGAVSVVDDGCVIDLDAEEQDTGGPSVDELIGQLPTEPEDTTGS